MEKRTEENERYSAFDIDLNRDHFRDRYKLKVKTNRSYAKALPIPENVDTYTFAKALKALLTADHIDYPADLRKEMAEGIIQRYELEEPTALQYFLRQSYAFHQHLLATFAPKALYRKYPIQLQIEKRQFDTVIDLLLHTADGLVIIQNSGFSGADKQRKSKALELSDWMYLSKLAVAEIFRESRILCLVHFGTLGSFAALQFQKATPQASTERADQLKLF